MARLAQIVVDSTHPATLARFWAEALDDFAVRPYDEAETARLAALGLTPESDPTVLVDGPGQEICFQQIDEAARENQRIHLDLATNDRRAEIDRLVNLGAKVHQDFADHTWMIDPEGNSFCLTDP